MKKPELNEKMLQRVEEIKLATYKYLQALLEVDDKEMEALGLWNDNILQKLSGYTMSILSRKNLFVCSPYIFEEYKIPYLCTLAECKCKKCVRQDEFMHKERMCAYVQDLLEGAGYQSKGVYRPYPDCRMKTNSPKAFCPVCQRAISRIIEFYTVEQ